MCKVIMSVAKETKGTFQFKEVVAPGNKALIGTLYVPKGTLESMGWADGKDLNISIAVAAETEVAPAQEKAKTTRKATTRKTATRKAATRKTTRKTA